MSDERLHTSLLGIEMLGRFIEKDQRLCRKPGARQVQALRLPQRKHALSDPPVETARVTYSSAELHRLQCCPEFVVGGGRSEQVRPDRVREDRRVMEADHGEGAPLRRR